MSEQNQNSQGQEGTGGSAFTPQPAAKKTVTRKIRYKALTLPLLGTGHDPPVCVPTHQGTYYVPRGRRVIVPEVVISNLQNAVMVKLEEQSKILLPQDYKNLPDGVPSKNFVEKKYPRFGTLVVDEPSDQEVKDGKKLSDALLG